MLDHHLMVPNIAVVGLPCRVRIVQLDRLVVNLQSDCLVETADSRYAGDVGTITSFACLSFND